MSSLIEGFAQEPPNDTKTMHKKYQCLEEQGNARAFVFLSLYTSHSFFYSLQQYYTGLYGVLVFFQGVYCKDIFSLLPNGPKLGQILFSSIASVINQLLATKGLSPCLPLSSCYFIVAVLTYS